MKDFTIEYTNKGPVYRSFLDSYSKVNKTIIDAAIQLEDPIVFYSTELMFPGRPNHPHHKTGFKFLFEQEALEHVNRFLNAINYNIPNDIELIQSNAWLLRVKQNTVPNSHNHINSWISGVIHLMDWDEGGALALDGNINYPSKKGQIVLFDSNHVHWVTAFEPQESPRYSIGFNIVPSTKLDRIADIQI